MTQARRCRIQGCGKTIVYPHIELCHRCYQWFYYWQQRTPKDLMSYVSRLELAQARATVLLQRTNIRRARRKAS